MDAKKVEFQAMTRCFCFDWNIDIFASELNTQFPDFVPY